MNNMKIIGQALIIAGAMVLIVGLYYCFTGYTWTGAQLGTQTIYIS